MPINFTISLEMQISRLLQGKDIVVQVYYHTSTLANTTIRFMGDPGHKAFT